MGNFLPTSEIFSPHVLLDDIDFVRVPGEPDDLPRGSAANRTRMRKFVLESARAQGGKEYLVRQEGTGTAIGITFEALVAVLGAAREGRVTGIGKASLPVLEALVEERRNISPEALLEIAQLASPDQQPTPAMPNGHHLPEQPAV